MGGRGGRGRGGARKRVNSSEMEIESRGGSRHSSGGGVRKRTTHDETGGRQSSSRHRNASSKSSIPYAHHSSGTGRKSAFGGTNTRRNETNVVEISNLVNRNEQEILQTLAQKAEFTPVETLWVGNKLLITCKSTKEAWAVKSKADNALYNGQKIVVMYFYKPDMESGNSNGSELISKLRQVIQSKYYPENQYLDLERFTSKAFDDEDPGKSNFGRALCKLIGEVCPDVQTISLASNGISDLGYFSDLYRHVPRLANISFKDNNLKNYDSLKGFKGKEFKGLHELILDGNPIKTKEVNKAATDVDFKSTVKSLFPTIKMLDGEPLMEEIKFGVEEQSEIPFPTKQGFFDSPATQSVVQDFLLKYCDLFDNNRPALGSFYEEQSSFSLSLAKNHKKDGPNTDLLFKNWMPFNRSLDRVTQADKRFKHLYIGFQAITNAIISLPFTKHPLQEPPEKKKFIFDAFQQGVDPVCLYIFLHGEIGVNDGSTKRSFDRTFVLIPALPGSRAAAAGLPVSIINDILTLRPFSGNDAWRMADSIIQPPTTLSATPNLPSDPALLAQLQTLHQLPNEQHAQVVQFAQVTGLNYSFSRQCLAESQWSNENAFLAFTNAKPQIPHEAFQIEK